MIEEWVTLEEAAGLEGCSYNAMQIRVSNKSEDFKLRKEKDSENGGKTRIFIAVSSLSNKARRVYRQRKKIAMSKYADLDEENAPWYVYADWGHYRENNRESYNRGIEMKRHVEECMSYEGKRRTRFIREYAGRL